jgi:hypothetical protein
MPASISSAVTTDGVSGRLAAETRSKSPAWACITTTVLRSRYKTNDVNPTVDYKLTTKEKKCLPVP